MKSFLGMINYYQRHLPNLASVLEPLHNLLRKNVQWRWGRKERNTFEKVKKPLCSPKLPVHYHNSLALIIAFDASPYRIGAGLSHKYPGNSERPIAYMSRSLSSVEKNYSQIGKESLDAVKKFDQYIYGRFTITTDRKPLLGILAENKSIPIMAASRMQRWAIIISACDYSLTHKSGKENSNADCLGRFPAENKKEQSLLQNKVFTDLDASDL